MIWKIDFNKNYIAYIYTLWASIITTHTEPFYTALVINRYENPCGGASLKRQLRKLWLSEMDPPGHRCLGNKLYMVYKSHGEIKGNRAARATKSLVYSWRHMINSSRAFYTYFQELATFSRSTHFLLGNCRVNVSSFRRFSGKICSIASASAPVV